MSVSRQEEIIGTLWLIAAILCFGFGFTFWGWALLVKAAFDQVAAIVVGAKELERKADQQFRAAISQAEGRKT